MLLRPIKIEEEDTAVYKGQTTKAVRGFSDFILTSLFEVFFNDIIISELKEGSTTNN